MEGSVRSVFTREIKARMNVRMRKEGKERRE